METHRPTRRAVNTAHWIQAAVGFYDTVTPGRADDRCLSGDQRPDVRDLINGMEQRHKASAHGGLSGDCEC